MLTKFNQPNSYLAAFVLLESFDFWGENTKTTKI